VGCHFLLQGNLPNLGIKPVSPELAGRFFTSEPPGKTGEWIQQHKYRIISSLYPTYHPASIFAFHLSDKKSHPKHKETRVISHCIIIGDVEFTPTWNLNFVVRYHQCSSYKVVGKEEEKKGIN